MAKYATAFSLLCLVLLLIVSTLMAAQVRLVSSAAGASSAIAAENSWATRAPMHEARSALGVAVMNGKIYAIGGFTGGGLYEPDFLSGSFVGTNEEYNPATDLWTYKASMPTPRARFAVAACQNKIYCIGGVTGENVIIGINEAYDPSTDTWETKAPMPTTIWKVQANVVNGKIYVITPSGTYVYDPVTDSWVSKTSIPFEMGSASTVFNDKIYVLGGFRGPPYLNYYTQIYNPETDSWSLGALMPSTVSDGGAGTTDGIMAPKLIYVLGISESGGWHCANEIYDPETDNWRVGADVPTDRLDFGVAVVDDMLYVIGGYTFYNLYEIMPSAINEEYTSIGYGTVPPVVGVVSPELNKTYVVGNVSLIFTLNKPTVALSYSLDGQANVTIAGNTTLTGLSSGLHNVTVYATDTLGSTGASEIVVFSVAKEPESFPTTPVTAGVIAAGTIVSIGFIVYFRKRKH
jgi:hypothetical protein